MNLIYLAYRLAGAIAPQILPALGYRLCRLIGAVLYQLNRPGRANIQRNLRYILGSTCPEAEIQRRSRLAFNYILYNYFDLFRLPRLDDEAVMRLVAIDGWENVEAALAGGHGLIMVSTHLGNIEVVIYEMLRRGLTITIPVERVKPPELFDYITKLRMSRGLKLVPIDGPLLELIRTLKKGGVVGLAADRDITQTGQIVEFFGRPARLPDGHLRLALKTGAPLVIGFSRRLADQTYYAYFLPSFSLPAGETEAARLAAGMRLIIAEMERAITQDPEQWSVTVSIWAEDQQ